MKINMKSGYKFLHFNDKNLALGTNENDNLIIFAPNGCGKTTIFNGIKSKYILINNTEYNDETFNSFDVSCFNYNNNIESFITMLMDKKVTNDELQSYFNSFNIDDTNNNINSIILKINEIFEQKLIINEINNKLSIYNKFYEIINNLNTDNDILNKRFSEIDKIKKNIHEIIEKELKVEFDNNINIDLNIIQNIISKNRENVFLYKNTKINNELIVKINNEIKNKYSNDTLKLINFYTENIEIIKNLNINNVMMIKNISKILYKQIQVLNYQKLVLENENDIKNNIEKYISFNNSYVKQVNDYINKINNFMDNSNLEWSIKIEPINNVIEKISYKYTNIYGEIWNECHASTGEEYILKLIFIMFTNIDKEFLILDDIFGSFDMNHINEFIDIFFKKDIINKKKPKILLLTHNYEIFKEISIECNIHTMPNDIKNEYWILCKDTDYKKDVPITIMCKNIPEIGVDVKIKNIFNLKKEYKYIESLWFLIIFKEVINNYIVINDKNNEYKNLTKFCDREIRHYSNKNNFKEIEKNVKNFLDKFSKNTELPIMKQIYQTLNNNKKTFSICNNILKIKNHISIFKNNKIENLNQYLLYKFILGMQIRYKFEQNAYRKFTKKEKKDWYTISKHERNQLIDKYCSKKLPSFNFNFITHWNSLNINRIMEIPIKKLKFILKSVNEIIK